MPRIRVRANRLRNGHGLKPTAVTIAPAYASIAPAELYRLPRMPPAIRFWVGVTSFRETASEPAPPRLGFGAPAWPRSRSGPRFPRPPSIRHTPPQTRHDSLYPGLVGPPGAGIVSRRAPASGRKVLSLGSRDRCLPKSTPSGGREPPDVVHTGGESRRYIPPD
jgi:hypothetical protein